MPRLKGRGIFRGRHLQSIARPNGPNRGEDEADCSTMPCSRRVMAAQKARERQNVARVCRVVRKMAQTLESI
jgi:hypothetical protein